MVKLEMAIRGLSYLLWTVLYVAVAAWVGEGQWHNTDARFLAALFFFAGWLPAGAALFEGAELPKEIAKAMMDDAA